MNHKPDQEPSQESGKNAAVDRRKSEAAMKVEIIERKPTTIVTFSIPNVELGAAFALAAVAVGLVAFVLLSIREFLRGLGVKGVWTEDRIYPTIGGGIMQKGYRDTRRCMLAIMWVAGALWVRTGIAAERATASEACEALLGVEISAAKIGLPTSGARIDGSRFVSATAEGNVNGEYCEVKGWIHPVNASSP